MTVSVVIPVLRSADFVPHHEHRQTKREQCGRQEILDLTVSKFLNIRIIGRAFDAAVPASIVVPAIAVVFAIWLVILMVIGNQVIKCESIMTGHKIYALFRLTFFVAVYLMTT